MNPILDTAANEAIGLGDAVEIAQWPCCNADQNIGQRFRVNAMERPRSGFIRCVECGTRHPTELDALGPYANWVPVAWLKRLDPATTVPEGTRLA